MNGKRKSVLNKIAIIANPAAGNKLLIRDMDQIVKKLNTIAGVVTVWQTEKAGDGAEIIRRVAPESDMVITAGGDGTVYECINSLCSLDDRPLFAILPGGTCNDFSRTLGISQNHLEAAEQITRMQERNIDVGKHGNHYFLNFWGIGLITQVSEHIQSDIKKRWGRLAYYLSAIQTMDERKTFYLEVESGHRQYRGEAMMMIVGNGAYVGGMDAYFPQSSVEDGLLDVLIIKDVSVGSLWSMAVSRLTDQAPEGSDLLYFHARKLKIRTAPVLKVDCDGEKNTFTPVHLSVLPGHLRMIVGEQYNT
nr:diacylglycerol kinase family protein [Paenactinomyces guangxiensis]